MVALKQLFDDPVVEFVAGRNFLWDGNQYVVGDTIANADIKTAHNRESLIRSRRVVAVTVDLNDVPRAYRKEIGDRALFFKKNHRSDVKLFDPRGRTIPVAEKALNDRPDTAVWTYALAREVTAPGANRTTLKDFIKAGRTGVSAASIEAYLKNDAKYATGQPLHEFTKATVVAAAGYSA